MVWILGRYIYGYWKRKRKILKLGEINFFVVRMYVKGF